MRQFMDFRAESPEIDVMESGCSEVYTFARVESKQVTVPLSRADTNWVEVTIFTENAKNDTWCLCFTDLYTQDTCTLKEHVYSVKQIGKNFLSVSNTQLFHRV